MKNQQHKSKGQRAFTTKALSGKQAPAALYIIPAGIATVYVFEAVKNGGYLGSAVLTASICLMISSLLVTFGWILAYKKMLMGATIRQIDSMSGEQFEDYLAYMYKRKGFNVKTTPKSCDFGGDLIVEDMETGTLTCIQAKRWRRNVGESAVQQAISGAQYYDCDNAMVITNSTYTDAAKKLANKCGVKMIDRFSLGTHKMYEI
ncbi:restriction endonuclease [Butyrivibrio proteoclasticus]|uniref:restriction endonuclease n=1 Tax=Butyrivibrio proteoclasticus TaxID=43305 RepID=UPI000684E32F|nr:restriction endonuclease [Butyrivibrio proteoclasticus]